MLSFVHVVGLLLFVPVNSYDHVETVSSPNHSFVQKLVKCLRRLYEIIKKNELKALSIFQRRNYILCCIQNVGPLRSKIDQIIKKSLFVCGRVTLVHRSVVVPVVTLFSSCTVPGRKPRQKCDCYMSYSKTCLKRPLKNRQKRS